ncbi:hypothetical protein diail_1998 [Diaporthe ilicicola]|nr:hypothetical protein diail_1998 [Diaporthe ilicicola]
MCISPPQRSDSDGEFTLTENDNDSVEEDSEVQYEQLVEIIANLVARCSWIGHIEERHVPVVQYTHAFLENIRNYNDQFDMSKTSSNSSNRLCVDCGDTNPSVNGHGTSGDANADEKRNRDEGRGNPRKRANDNDGGPSRNGSEEFENAETNPGDTKRVKTDDCQRLPCPYRKRHPTKFNVREYSQCVLNTFGNMALLK